MRFPGLLVRVAVAMAAALVAVPTVPARADTPVKIRDNFFTPVYKVITVGERVTWTNEGDDRHTVTTYDGAPDSFDSSPTTVASCEEQDLVVPSDCIEPGGTYTIEFALEGEYNYRCKIHGDPVVMPDKRAGAQEQPCGMCAVIKVVEERRDFSEPRRDPKPSPTREEPRETRSPSASPSASETAGTPTAVGSPLAAPGGGGGGGRAALALLAVTVLGFAGWWTWRKYLV